MMAKGEMRDYAEPLVPDFHEMRYGDAADLAAKISERTAAVVLEPVRTDCDMAIPPAGYFAEVRRLCDRTGAKLIIDEVVCGMGRLGHAVGLRVFGVEPDMLVTAKGFSGGLYPMSAVVTRPECLDFFGESPYRSISSFAWSNIGARISSCRPRRNRAPAATPRRAGRRSSKRASRRCSSATASVLRAVRRAGMMFALDFADADAGMRFLAAMFRRGVLVVASSQRLDIIKLYPPLILDDEHVAAFSERMETALQRVS